MSETTPNRLDELRELLREADQAVNGPPPAPQHLDELINRLRGSLADARPALEELRARAREEMYRADDYVRTHPYQTAGLAALVGTLVGLALTPRKP